MTRFERAVMVFACVGLALVFASAVYTYILGGPS